MLLALFNAALACTGAVVFHGFEPNIHGVETWPTDARFPLRANEVTDIRLTNLDTGVDEPPPTLEHLDDFYVLWDTMMVVPAQELDPNTTYELWAADTMLDGEDTLTINTGPGPAAEPGTIEILDLEATALEPQTNDCVVGTHRPRELTVTFEISAWESQLTWVELENRDLRTWVARPIPHEGVNTLNVFQPVQGGPQSDAVNCITARVVNAAGDYAESDEVCIEIDEDPGCGCSHGTPGNGWLWLVALAITTARGRTTASSSRWPPR